MSRPISASANKRYGVINYDNYIDVILASRTKKITFQLPSVSDQYLHPTAPRIVHLSAEDYEHVYGEVTGVKYDYPSRPELDILLINGSYDREHESMLEVNYDIPVLAGSKDPSRPVSANPANAANAANAGAASADPSRPPTSTGGGRPPSAAPKNPSSTASRPASAKDRYEHEKVHHIIPKTHKLDQLAVPLLYDAAKETYVLCDEVILQIMKLHTLFIPQYRQLRQQMFGEHDILLPQIKEDEEFVEETKPLRTNDRHIEIVIVRSYAVLGKEMMITYDKKREKVWRRFLRYFIPIWFKDEHKLEALRELIQLDIEAEEKRRQDAMLPIVEGDANSTDSSTAVKKKKKKKGTKKGKDKDGKGKKGKDSKKKGKAETEDEDDGDDDEEESDSGPGGAPPAGSGIAMQPLQKPSSPSQGNNVRNSTPTSPGTRKKK